MQGFVNILLCIDVIKFLHSKLGMTSITKQSLLVQSGSVLQISQTILLTLLQLGILEIKISSASVSIELALIRFGMLSFGGGSIINLRKEIHVKTHSQSTTWYQHEQEAKLLNRLLVSVKQSLNIIPELANCLKFDLDNCDSTSIICS